MVQKARNNCTVNALSVAAGIGYERADEIADGAGRKPGRGIKSAKVIEHAKRYGVHLDKMRLGPRTVQRFIREYPTGNYYARKRGHAFAIVNGVCVDPNVGPMVRIVDVWRLREAA